MYGAAPGTCPPISGFTRTMLRDHYKIVLRSTCDYCRTTLVGSDTESMREDEREHRETCDATTAAAS